MVYGLRPLARRSGTFKNKLTCWLWAGVVIPSTPEGPRMIADQPDSISSKHSIGSRLRGVTNSCYFIAYVYPLSLFVAAPFLASLYRWLGLDV